MFPKYVIRIGGSHPSKNDIRIYFSRETLMQDLLMLWGNADIAVQLYIKQKHLVRGASMLRYHANKSGNVYKA